MKTLEEIIRMSVDETLQEKGLFHKESKRNSTDTKQRTKKNLSEAYVTQAGSFNLQTELLSSKTKKSHKELLDGYVKTLNAISSELDGVDKSSANLNKSTFRSLKMDETYNHNAAFLHGLYFENISDLSSSIGVDSLSYMRLARDFGSFDEWQKDFLACCNASQNGWAITYLNTYTQKYMNCFIDLHSENVPFGSYPVIVMDVWQHAYYRDYLKDVSLYSKAMMKELNWKVIEKRIEKADRLLAIIRG